MLYERKKEKKVDDLIVLSSEDLRKLQLAEMKVLQEVIEICNNNGLSYFVIGGTLLGAVRHGGFIPWDDDIDVAMPREDYEKFISIASNDLSKKYELMHYTVKPEYYLYIMKIIDRSIVVQEERGNGYKSNLWIDILPIDGVPNNKFIYRVYKLKVLAFRALLGFANIDRIRNIDNRPLIEKILISFARIVPIGKIISRNYVRKSMDKLFRSMKIKKSNNVGTYLGAYGFREVVPKDYFGKGTFVKFEDLEVRAPEKVDVYLKHIYGDYMKLPPEDKRQCHIVNVDFGVVK